MADLRRNQPQQKAVEPGALECRENERRHSSSDDDSSVSFLNSPDRESDANLLVKQALKVKPDQAILRLARALARRAAREDYSRACAEKAGNNETSRDIRTLLDRSSE